MIINFFEATCQGVTETKLFGLCDDPPPSEKASYIDKRNGSKWIAIVVNEDRYRVVFTAIDRCIDIRRADGSMDKRCDGVLTYDSTIIFVELKERGALGNKWVKDAEEQLRTTIGYFEREEDAEKFNLKKAYIANSEHPKFKESQNGRMNKFLIDTGYVLRIENRIIL